MRLDVCGWMFFFFVSEAFWFFRHFRNKTMKKPRKYQMNNIECFSICTEVTNIRVFFFLFGSLEVNLHILFSMCVYIFHFYLNQLNFYRVRSFLFIQRKREYFNTQGLALCFCTFSLLLHIKEFAPCKKTWTKEERTFVFLSHSFSPHFFLSVTRMWKASLVKLC